MVHRYNNFSIRNYFERLICHANYSSMNLKFYKMLSKNDINAPIHLSIICNNFDFWCTCQGHHEFYHLITYSHFLSDWKKWIFGNFLQKKIFFKELYALCIHRLYNVIGYWLAFSPRWWWGNRTMLKSSKYDSWFRNFLYKSGKTTAIKIGETQS